MRDWLGRHWRGLRGDWKYPAALAILVLAATLAFSQYQQWTGANDTHATTQVVIRQNDDLRKQIDAVSSTSACRSQINATVNSTFGQVVNAQGRETAAVGQLIVDIFQQDRTALAAGVGQLSAINQLLATATTAYQAALDRQRDQDAICAQDIPTTTIAQEHS